MPLKIKKIFIVFFGFLFLIVGFFYFTPSKIFASALEVNYPVLATGESLGPTSSLPEYFIYIYKAGIFLGFFSVFISLVIAGVLYLLSPISPDALSMAKDRISGAITGLIILSTLYLIITTINPQLSFFNFTGLGKAPEPPPEKKQAGVYFYNSEDCSGKVSPLTSSARDLGELKNAKSISIEKDSANAYVSVLYDIFNFQGKCQYIDPNVKCNTLPGIFNSASIYNYDYSPNGDGVYFYRKSFFNKNGGYYKVPNQNIKNSASGIYIESLENLQFSGNNSGGCTVPEEEQDCIKWEKNGICKEKKCPALAGENISSIEIKGNYFVLLVYFSPTDKAYGPWTYCQAFPTLDDINKNGPKQIKWDFIRNSGGVIPNYMVIIPVSNK
ncbi:MAG: hypothetical protein AAB352_00555 [Patescibacteria group bacterium]